jgi:hypothetical protein
MILAWVGKINMTMRSQRLTILIGILFGDASRVYTYVLPLFTCHQHYFADFHLQTGIDLAEQESTCGT